MSSFESLIEKAIEDRAVAGVVLLARDKSGKFAYTRAHGLASLATPGRPSQPMTPSTVFALASMTKLLTTVACLQLVERGVLTLDGDVSALVPALAAQPVLSGFRDDGSPVTVPRSEPITLRRLLTHSAGPGYMFLDERLMRWKAHQREQRRKEQRAQRSNSTGDKDRKRSSSRSRSSNRSRSSTPSTALEKKKTTLERRFDYPLLFQPGSGWVYGSGVAWAGRVVEVATGTDLETYFAAYVFAPLGITDITFWPGERGGVFTARRAGMTTREPDSGKVVGTEAPEPDTTDCLGGEGAFGALDDYLRVLQSLLADDGRLLRPETAALMFEPQLARAGAGSPDPAAAKQALRASLAHPEWAVGDIPATGEYDWGLGGLLTDGDSHPYRRRGCLIWSGMYNLFWFIDRSAGLCGVFGSQVLPPGDPTIRRLMQAFEEEMYAKVSELDRQSAKL